MKEETNMKNIIYGLADSRNDLIYYVGKSSVGKSRPLTHLLGNSHSKDVNEWIKNMNDNWVPVCVMLLDETEDVNDLPSLEIKWINKCASLNPDLLNKKCLPAIINDPYTEEDDLSFHRLSSSLSFVGRIIRRRRLACGLTQEELAELSGVHRTTVRDAELTDKATLSTLKSIVLALTGESIKLNSKSQLSQRATMDKTTKEK